MPEFVIGTPVTLETLALILCTVASPSQYGTLHHDVSEVRTFVTASPASERSKWWPPLVTSASTSDASRKSSIVTTHGPSGGRDSTVTRSP